MTSIPYQRTSRDVDADMSNVVYDIIQNPKRQVVKMLPRKCHVWLRRTNEHPRVAGRESPIPDPGQSPFSSSTLITFSSGIPNPTQRIVQRLQNTSLALSTRL